MNPASQDSACSPTPQRDSLAAMPGYASSCGRVTLYLGDCMDIAPTLQGVDALISDPPYGISVNTRNGSRVNAPPHGVKFSGKDWQAVHGDDQPFDPSPWLKWKKIVLWGANNYASRLPDSPSWLAWNKRVPDGFKKSQTELAWMIGAGRCAYHFDHLWNGVCRDSEQAEGSLHPTQKPVALMAWCMDKAKVPAGALVLDPYMGSGTTGIACIRTGRRFVGIEKDPAHYATALARITNELAQGDLFLGHNV